MSSRLDPMLRYPVNISRIWSDGHSRNHDLARTICGTLKRGGQRSFQVGRLKVNVMQYNSIISEIIDRIISSKDMSSLGDCITYIRDSYELANVAYCNFSSDINGGENPLLLQTYPGEWIEVYINRSFMKTDPVVKLASKSYVPLDWSSIKRDSIEVRRFFTEVERCSVGRQGLTVPVRGPVGDKALFTITSHVGDKEWRTRKLDYMREFQLLSQYVHHQVSQLCRSNLPPVRATLSRREKECLALMTRGLMPKQIAGKLEISETAVRTYVRSARFKLGCSSPTQAVARAVSLELIDA